MRKIVSICGTSRPQSYTGYALAVVNQGLRDAGIEPTVFDAQRLDLAFPGMPETEDATRMKQVVSQATGIILATPEYHGSFCAMTKLIIENLGFPSVLSGKPIALLGVAAGRIGAIKSLEQLRGVCSHVGAIVVPGSTSIAGVRKLFDEQGRCTDEDTLEALQRVPNSLLNFLKEYVCPKHTLEAMVRGDDKGWSATL